MDHATIEQILSAKYLNILPSSNYCIELNLAALLHVIIILFILLFYLGFIFKLKIK